MSLCARIVASKRDSGGDVKSGAPGPPSFVINQNFGALGGLPAVAREPSVTASEGWRARQGSNLRPSA